VNSVVDPDPVGSGPFGRIRIRNFYFKPDPDPVPDPDPTCFFTQQLT